MIAPARADVAVHAMPEDMSHAERLEATRHLRLRVQLLLSAQIGVVLTALAIPLSVATLVPGAHLVLVPLLTGLLASLGAVMAEPARRFARLIVPDPPAPGAPHGPRSAALEDHVRYHAAREIENLLELTGINATRVKFVEACLTVSKAPKAVGKRSVAIGAALTGMSFVVTPFPAPMSIFMGLGIALGAWGAAVLTQMPRLGKDAEPQTQPEAALRAPPATEALLTGEMVLEALRKSSIYRRQIRVEHLLAGQPPVWDAAHRGTANDVLRRFRERFARIDDEILGRVGIERLTDSQARALEKVLEALDAKRPQQDFVFSGAAGSGRSTLANLLTLATLLNRQGAVYCVGAESPERTVVSGSIGRARGPVQQFQSWLSDDTSKELRDRVQVSFSDKPDAELHLNGGHDVFFMDVRLLAEGLLSPGQNGVRGLLQRLRYVVIDHPDRLGREELIRLRLALGRLRLLAQMMRRELSFILLIPPLDNSAQLAKWLLNNETVEPLLFDAWPRPSRMVLWQAPMDVENASTAQPQFLRAPFDAELQKLVTEAVVIADRLHDERLAPKPQPLHLGVIDAQGLLGPEARLQLRQRCINALRQGKAYDTTDLAIHVDLTFIGTESLLVRGDGEYDVLLVVGIGSHPARMLALLRRTLRPDGVLFLISDESPDDLAAVRELCRPGWEPPSEHVHTGLGERDHGDPCLALPSPSEPLVAWELAGFLASLGSTAVAEQRIYEVFPAASSRPLVASWVAEGSMERYQGFETHTQSHTLQRGVFLRRKGDGVVPERYELPWGCLTRDVLEVRDIAARSHGRVGQRREVGDRVDRDRLFIDLYPGAMLRIDPNSVHVDAVSLFEDHDTPGFRAELVGSVALGQPFTSEAIVVDRRRPRFRLQILDEHPTPEPTPLRVNWTGDRRTISVLPALAELPPLGALFTLAPGPADELEQRNRLLHKVAELRAPGLNAVPAWIGSWNVRLQEDLRDVLMTHERLIDAPRFTRRAPVDDGYLRLVQRAYLTQAVTILFAREGVSAEAVRAIAGALRRYLGRRVLNFEDNFAVDVLPVPEIPGHARARILVRGRRSAELDESSFLLKLIKDEWRHFLSYAVALLEHCNCPDGCSACCASLGQIAVAEWADLPEGQTLWDRDQDAISRTEALQLLTGLLGEWPRRVPPPSTHLGAHDSLPAMVAEIIGSESAQYRDGRWHRLFGELMPLHGIAIAPASWMEASEDPSGTVLGYYYGGQNKITIRATDDRNQMLSTILHEFVHNWQWEHPGFNHEQHRHSVSVQPYFEGKLIIEGHARWAEQQFHVSQGWSPVETITDGRWNEYKTGFFLMQGIDQAFGQEGLFLWLKHGQGPMPEGITPPRSNHPALKQFPFALREALEAFGLLEEALTGRYDGIDVREDSSASSPARSPAADEPGATVAMPHDLSP